MRCWPRSLTSSTFLIVALICTSNTLADDDLVPDFSLLDVNASSPTYEQEVSPRDFIQQATGWYFGHAT